MADVPMTFKQMRVCVMRADEIANNVDTGSDDIERLNEICDRYDAEFHLDMMDLADTLAIVLGKNRHTA
jgi:hypothetical protein